MSGMGDDDLFSADRAELAMRQQVAVPTWTVQLVGAGVFVGTLLAGLALASGGGPGPMAAAIALAALGSALAILLGRSHGVTASVCTGAFVVGLEVIAPTFPTMALTLLLSVAVALEVGR